MGAPDSTTKYIHSGISIWFEDSDTILPPNISGALIDFRFNIESSLSFFRLQERAVLDNYQYNIYSWMYLEICSTVVLHHIVTLSYNV